MKKSPSAVSEAATAALVAQIERAAKSVPAKKVAVSVKKGQPLHAIADAARPSKGKMMFAHTHATLSALGLLNQTRPAVGVDRLTVFLGKRAVDYHTEVGNFECDGSKVRLSTDGLAKFRGRATRIAPALIDAFTHLIVEGRTDGTGVRKSDLYSA